MKRPLARPRAGLPGTRDVLVDERSVRVDDVWWSTIAVTAYPREVSVGWLDAVAGALSGGVVSVHVEPMPQAAAADRLRRQMARLESSRRLDASRGRLADPEVEAAAADARELAERVARGEARLFRVGVSVSARAASADDVAEALGRVRTQLAAMLAEAAPATFRALQGWVTTLPLGIDGLGITRTFDTPALAAAFPFAAAGSGSTDGVWWGTTPGGGLLFWDRFAQPNYNAVILARSGAGKSYLAKLQALRSLYAGVEVAVLDPEGEYARMAAAVGGSFVDLGRGEVALNPLTLAGESDAFARRLLFLHGLIEVLIGGLDATEHAALDDALVAAYSAVGITGEPRTWQRPAPTLRDVADQLAADDAPGPSLARRLSPWTTGAASKWLCGRGGGELLDGRFVVVGLAGVEATARPGVMAVVLDALWRRVTSGEHRRRELVVDEAWQLLGEAAGAEFCQRLARTARKHWCGLTVVSQDAADVLSSDASRAVVTNAATQVLLAQAPQGVEALAQSFSLSAGERSYLLSAQPGEGVLSGGGERIAFRAQASPVEHALVTTDPAELEAQRS